MSTESSPAPALPLLATIDTTPTASRESTRPVPPMEVEMSWKLRGSYVETCSCDLICPCNASFDHGAVCDFCRCTTVLHIHEGESREQTSPV
jgi:hypothetical protein